MGHPKALRIITKVVGFDKPLDLNNKAANKQMIDLQLVNLQEVSDD